MVFLSIKPPYGANSRLGCASNLMVIGPAAVIQRDETQYLRPSFAGLCGDVRDKCQFESVRRLTLVLRQGPHAGQVRLARAQGKSTQHHRLVRALMVL